MHFSLTTMLQSKVVFNGKIWDPGRINLQAAEEQKMRQLFLILKLYNEIKNNTASTAEYHATLQISV